ncbi:MAG: hypothetical protein MHMPM18_002118 [Marteilia pararefringens]
MMTSSSAAAASCIGEGEVQPQAAAAASRGQQDNDDNNDDERQQAIDCFNAPTWCDFEKMMNGEQNSLSDAYLSDFFGKSSNVPTTTSPICFGSQCQAASQIFLVVILIRNY